jgi:hypothetical protein
MVESTEGRKLKKFRKMIITFFLDIKKSSSMGHFNAKFYKEQLYRTSFSLKKSFWESKYKNEDFGRKILITFGASILCSCQPTGAKMKKFSTQKF